MQKISIKFQPRPVDRNYIIRRVQRELYKKLNCIGLTPIYIPHLSKINLLSIIIYHVYSKRTISVKILSTIMKKILENRNIYFSY